MEGAEKGVEGGGNPKNGFFLLLIMLEKAGPFNCRAEI